MRTYTRVLGGLGMTVLAAFFVACTVPMTDSGAVAKSAISASSAASSLSSSASLRSGALHITKDCSAYTGLAGSFCTITSSNLKAIEVGTRVVYAAAAAADHSLNSDITLVPLEKDGNLVFGHVVLPAAGNGLVTLSGGTGKFTHFEARVVVSMLSPDGIKWAWDGWYSFGDRGKG